MFSRTLENTIKEKINSGKAIVVVGARQVGKTTLLKEILKEKEHLFLDADDPTTRSLLSNTEQIGTLIGDSKCIFLDEAQRIPGIGLTLKIITDQFKDVQLFVSGSSSFDLGNELNEPLTGRKWAYEMFPISWVRDTMFLSFLYLDQFSRNLLMRKVISILLLIFLLFLVEIILFQLLYFPTLSLIDVVCFQVHQRKNESIQ